MEGVITSIDSKRPYPIPPIATLTVSLAAGAVVTVVSSSVVVVTVLVVSVVVVVAFSVVVVSVVGCNVVEVVKSPSHELRGGVKGPETQESHSPISSSLQSRNRKQISVCHVKKVHS